MALPIDPRDVDPADVGEEQATLELDHEPAIELVRETCEATGFGIPVEFSPSALLNEKVGADRDPYYVLGACNPQMADRALDASDGRIGALFPCNLIVWQESPGRQRVYHVSIMRVARLVGLAPDDDVWDDIVADTGDLVDEFFDRLADHEDATYPVPAARREQ
jgi:uncharacterized protein (DUF302 family)